MDLFTAISVTLFPCSLSKPPSHSLHWIKGGDRFSIKEPGRAGNDQQLNSKSNADGMSSHQFEAPHEDWRTIVGQPSRQKLPPLPSDSRKGSLAEKNIAEISWENAGFKSPEPAPLSEPLIQFDDGAGLPSSKRKKRASGVAFEVQPLASERSNIDSLRQTAAMETMKSYVGFETIAATVEWKPRKNGFPFLPMPAYAMQSVQLRIISSTAPSLLKKHKGFAKKLLGVEFERTRVQPSERPDMSFPSTPLTSAESGAIGQEQQENETFVGDLQLRIGRTAQSGKPYHFHRFLF
jgi:hypothetical protein